MYSPRQREKDLPLYLMSHGMILVPYMKSERNYNLQYWYVEIEIKQGNKEKTL